MTVSELKKIPDFFGKVGDLTEIASHKGCWMMAAIAPSSKQIDPICPYFQLLFEASLKTTTPSLSFPYHLPPTTYHLPPTTYHLL
ncbi:hypothetical protein K9N68_28400 [Kovacikia minuta CCNUW1]|uniref:hypothetical protein n=1 Tax=Kovacikia minuta TaxID=2931930 RepID=UPI001CCB9409|nr:hypothetical protein [Kovacikia minuta]UBF25466.1 hypothetical protein K9N68_28400 [Kovacikia minuta CCNUW1]